MLFDFSHFLICTEILYLIDLIKTAENFNILVHLKPVVVHLKWLFIISFSESNIYVPIYQSIYLLHTHTHTHTHTHRQAMRYVKEERLN